MDTANAICTKLARGLRGKLGLSEVECYPSIAPIAIPGMPPRCLQIIPEGVTVEGAGQGHQSGGALRRRMTIRLAYWHRLMIDAAGGYTVQVLTEEAEGVLDFMEKLRKTLALTWLGDTLAEPIRYMSESGTMMADEETGQFRRDLLVSAVWIDRLPHELTLVAADLLEDVQS